MADYSNFVSTSSIKAKEEQLSQARQSILEKAKKKYEADELREKKKKETGEGTWMLDTVSKRIHKEQKNLEEKSKKKKKKLRKRSDSSSSGDDEEEAWVESKAASSSSASQPTSDKIQRDSWMEAPIDLFPTVTRQELRDEANKEKEKAKRKAEKHLQPGQHARELNPYWKNGGTGLPSNQQSLMTSSTTSSSSNINSGAMGDAGLSWMLKSMSRMKEQAREEGRSLEDIAAERYGSLDRLMSMIHDAEKSQGNGRDGPRRHMESRERDRHSDIYDDRRNDRNGARLGNDRVNERRHRDGRDGDRTDSKGRRRDSPDSKSRSSQGSRFKRPGSDDEDRHREYDKRDGHREEGGSSISSRRSGFRRPGSDNESDEDSSSKRRAFRNPDGSVRYGSNRSRHEDVPSDRRRHLGVKNYFWRKSVGEKDRGGAPRWKKAEAKDVKDETKKKPHKKRDKSPSASPSSSSGSSDQSDDDDGKYDRRRKASESDEEPKAQPPPKVLSEAELNDLAAKVVRAEIMGDEALVSKLKATLEEARRLRESSKATGSGKRGQIKYFQRSKSKRMEKGGKTVGEGGEDDNVVVLSRTNKAGMVRPVLPSYSSPEWVTISSGRKRKNMATHSEGGERTKFFHDDDNFDLKTLVEREKAGTAEDQNAMFARLAGRETDRDMDVDDMFVNKAARGRQEEDDAKRDKLIAIMEHRKKSSVMEKCTRCFDKVPKHLIVAIGRKSYLCLPDHASLTEGHCLIVPIAHATSATTLDEDVWQDVQQFRKSLVRMFLSQEKDVVIMETVMNLKYFPHTIIECIPLEQELGDLAPIYFKKAMLEAGPEWSHNKKVHELSKKDVRHTIPKGFPYFSVDFGLQGGFAHVIEEEATFPSYFGREIVGGMLDAEPGLWRKPRKQNFEDQRRKMLQFEQWWSPFDWTQDIG